MQIFFFFKKKIIKIKHCLWMGPMKMLAGQVNI